MMLSCALITSAATPSAHARGRSQRGAPTRVAWATNVHNLMIDVAFSAEDEICRARMAGGSRRIDDHQNSGEAYMHAMKSKSQREKDAIDQMWQFIEEAYDQVKLIEKSDYFAACEVRGMALHPIMDSTSPAHAGFQKWDPIRNPKQIFEHGDWIKVISRYLPVAFPGPSSKEDIDYIDDHPGVLKATAAIMRTIDEIERTLRE